MPIRPTSRRDTEFVSVDDRRREPRLQARGEVELFLEDDSGDSIIAILLDVSSSGFRAAHDCSDLHTGLELDFQHPQGSGRARIMWNRVVDGRWESGFFVTGSI